MGSFQEKTASGVIWSVAGQAGRQTATIACNIVLARLLTPAEFGLTASVLIFANFAVVVAEQGFGAALVQRKTIEERHISSVFWVNLLAGVVMCALFAVGAPMVTWTFGQPELTSLTRAIGSLFWINALGAVHYTLLQRSLDFKSLARAETAAAWAGGIASIAAAYMGAGAWSIVVQSLVTAGASSIYLWLLSAWRPRLVFDRAAVGELMGFSTDFFMSASATYWVRNVDNLLVGAVLGPRQLGLYTRAYAVMLFPLNRITRVLARVMLPSLSIIQDEPARVKSLFLRMTRVVALATFPLMLVVIACAEDFVGTLFGPNWGDMVPTLRVLAMVGLVQSVSVLQASIFNSQAQTSLRLKIQIPLHALELAGIYFGLRGGILGVASGYALASAITAPLGIYFAGGLVGLKLTEFAANLVSILACAAPAAAAAFGAGLLLPPAWPAPVRLALESAAAGLVYVALLKSFNVAAWQDFVAQMRKSLGKPLKTALVVSNMDNLSLSLARALVDRGWRVVVAGAGPGTSLRLSWSCARYARIALEPAEIVRVAKEEGASLVIPADVKAGRLAAALARELPGVVLFPTPPDEALKLEDKWMFHSFIRDLGLPQPETRLVASPADAGEFPLPLILKPRAEAGGFGIRVVRAKEELGEGGETLAQEFVPGREVSMSFLADGGRLLAWAIHVRRDDGALEYLDDPRVVEFGRKVIAACRYRGIGNIDMRYDDNDPSRVLLIEINPRFWGSYSYSRGLNVDFLGLGLELAAGRAPAEQKHSPKALCPGVLASARGLLAGEVNGPGRVYLKQKLLDPVPELWKAANNILGFAREL